MYPLNCGSSLESLFESVLEALHFVVAVSSFQDIRKLRSSVYMRRYVDLCFCWFSHVAQVSRAYRFALLRTQPPAKISFCCSHVSEDKIETQRVHVPNNSVLGIWVVVIIVQVSGKYMIIGYLDP